MAIPIQPNKHIALLFEARSGSTVLRHFLATVLNYGNLNEYFNHRVGTDTLRIEGTDTYFTPGTGTRTNLTDSELAARSKGHLEILNQLTAINRYMVFCVMENSYREAYPTLTNELSKRSDIQPIRLVRADYLYSIISIMVSRNTGQWHNSMVNSSLAVKKREVKPFSVNIHLIEKMMLDYVISVDELNENFENAPIIYYEQFQTSPASMMNLFSGIPKKLVSVDLTKFSGNHKDLVENLDEVEDFYEQFVNDHKEYFPQYFGKLPHVQIPACQGRQPRDLSRHDQLRAENC